MIEELKNTFENFNQRISKKNIISKNSKKKANRNDPCPCGSGKKFKRCCGSL